MELQKTATQCLRLRASAATWRTASQRTFSISSRCAAEKGKAPSPGLGWGGAGLGGNKSRAPSSVFDSVRGKTNPSYDLSKMNIPSSATSPPPMPSNTPFHGDLMKSLSRSFANAIPEKPALRLVPAAGRTIAVRQEIDPTKAFQQLEALCRRNSVKQDMNSQKFYERPGLKRKRLRSSRWRFRFRNAFQATVSRVNEMKRQGW